MTDTKELIALVSEFLESVHAGEWTGDVSRDEALVALESLTQQLAELQAKLEDALKDRVALAMALDCGHRPPCEECRLYPPTARQAQPEQRWKADQQAAEILVGLAAAAINARAQIAVAEAQSSRDKELAELRAEVAALREKQGGQHHG